MQSEQPAADTEFVSRLLDLVTDATVTFAAKPWGSEVIIDTGVFLLKYIEVDALCRTSLQYHERKEEVTVVVGPDNFGTIRRVKPGVQHRAEGPLQMIEITTMENDDVVRVEDDYGR